MTVKGRLKSINSNSNKVVARFVKDDKVEAELDYHDDMELICKRPRRWHIKAYVALGSSEPNHDALLTSPHLCSSQYRCDDKLTIKQVVTEARNEIASSVGESTVPYCGWLIIHART